MGWGDLGEVLHEVPHTAFGDDTLGHAVRPPALLVEFGKLDFFGKPDCEVVVQGSALLKFSYPDIAEGDAPSLAPLADRFEAV